MACLHRVMHMSICTASTVLFFGSSVSIQQNTSVAAGVPWLRNLFWLFREF